MHALVSPEVLIGPLRRRVTPWPLVNVVVAHRNVGRIALSRAKVATCCTSWLSLISWMLSPPRGVSCPMNQDKRINGRTPPGKTLPSPLKKTSALLKQVVVVIEQPLLLMQPPSLLVEQLLLGDESLCMSLKWHARQGLNGELHLEPGVLLPKKGMLFL